MEDAHEAFVWDDRTWNRVWDVLLDPVERHGIAMSVLRRRPPRDPFEERVALELASRWGRRAISLGTVYLLWTLFWGSLLWKASRWEGVELTVPLGCTVVGVAAVAACWRFRRRMRRYVSEHASP